MQTTHQKLSEETQTIELVIGTFIISTVLFAFYMFTSQNANVLLFAFPFAVSVLFLNAIMLFHLTGRFIKLYKERKDIAVKIFLLLSNIPIAYLYYSVAMKL
ncbi:hypothetical protein [Flavobacterium chungangense]|uniref:Uncharacterized protein n=1 Tax=Flavobacterium chungangense TaxID=554283 RepID=A0A6V6Z6X8_9FLAO|nr:hypothetical protein [Flavobacterium chungangense]CAD0007520.1 hypothetical protein FLACHUCJ7_03349 [Flavobacterium chungangense]